MKKFLQFVTEDKDFEALHPRDKIGRFAKKRERKLNLSSEEEAFMRQMIRYGFPNCNENNSRIIGEPTPAYNCIGFAFGDNERWWWPGDGWGMYWPEEAKIRNDDTDDLFDEYDEPASFYKLLSMVDAEETDDDEYEEGFVKVALYFNGREITHMSRLLDDDGNWASKLGDRMLVEHEYDALNGGPYGRPKKIFRIPIDKFKTLRNME